MTKDDPDAALAALPDCGPLDEIVPAPRLRSRTGAPPERVPPSA
jgi:hypothetical protein